MFPLNVALTPRVQQPGADIYVKYLEPSTQFFKTVAAISDLFSKEVQYCTVKTYFYILIWIIALRIFKT